MITRLAQRMKGDDGLSLVEMVVASALFAIVLVATLSVVDSGTKAEQGQQVRSDALLDAREAMTRMTKEVRQALSVAPTSTGTLLDIQTLIAGVPTRVVYQRLTTSITRSVNGGTPAPVVENVAPSQTFCYHFVTTCQASTPAATVSSIRIVVKVTPQQTGASPVTLATDVKLRNL